MNYILYSTMKTYSKELTALFEDNYLFSYQKYQSLKIVYHNINYNLPPFHVSIVRL